MKSMNIKNLPYEILCDFKEKLSKNQSVIGPFMKTGDPAFVEAAGYAGFDFVILDLEHGPGSIESMQNNIRAAEVAGAFPIIRVMGPEEQFILRALDIGALGIQVPQVNSVNQAKEAIKNAKFYPKGSRGVCRFQRAAQYAAMDRFEFFEKSNETIIILQLEGQEGLNNLDEILSIEGFDILFIGPYDLSQSLGIPGQIKHQKVIEKMEYIVQKAKAAHKVIGTFVDEPENILRWKSSGVQYLSYSVDTGLFTDACKRIVKIHEECNH
jgi:4-hydroxy-2-oxoheptanedioate aldolase